MELDKKDYNNLTTTDWHTLFNQIIGYSEFLKLKNISGFKDIIIHIRNLHNRITELEEILSSKEDGS